MVAVAQTQATHPLFQPDTPPAAAPQLSAASTPTPSDGLPPGNLPQLSAMDELYYSQQAQLAQFQYQKAASMAGASRRGAQAVYNASRDDINRQYKVDRHVLPGDFAQRGIIRSGLFDEAIAELKSRKTAQLEMALAQKTAATAQASAAASMASQELNMRLQMLEAQKAAQLTDMATQIELAGLTGAV